MGKNTPVHPAITMLIAVIPFGCFWSFWRVSKLRLGIILFLILFGLDLGIDYAAMYIIEDGHPEISSDGEMYKILTGNESDPVYIAVFMGNLAILYAIYFYFIYRWTAKYNRSLPA